MCASSSGGAYRGMAKSVAKTTLAALRRRRTASRSERLALACGVSVWRARHKDIAATAARVRHRAPNARALALIAYPS